MGVVLELCPGETIVNDSSIFKQKLRNKDFF